MRTCMHCSSPITFSVSIWRLEYEWDDVFHMLLLLLHNFVSSSNSIRCFVWFQKVFHEHTICNTRFICRHEMFLSKNVFMPRMLSSSHRTRLPYTHIYPKKFRIACRRIHTPHTHTQTHTSNKFNVRNPNHTPDAKWLVRQPKSFHRFLYSPIIRVSPIGIHKQHTHTHSSANGKANFRIDTRVCIKVFSFLKAFLRQEK